jgi:Na+-transporting methylmalonyl-CoA/oxaloacetate decarboxylase gamma subunit
MKNDTGIFPVSKYRSDPNWLGILGLLLGFLILAVQLIGLAKQEAYEPAVKADTSIEAVQPGQQLLNE